MMVCERIIHFEDEYIHSIILYHLESLGLLNATCRLVAWALSVRTTSYHRDIVGRIISVDSASWSAQCDVI